MPFAVVVYACGDVHVAYVPAPAGVSSLHSNVAPASDVNVNDGAVELMVPVGPLMSSSPVDRCRR